MTRAGISLSSGTQKAIMFPPGDQEKSLQNKENTLLAQERLRGKHATAPVGRTLGSGRSTTRDAAGAHRGLEALL